MKGQIRFLILVVTLLFSNSMINADDVNISYSELPGKAKSFMEKHFGANVKAYEIEYENASGIYAVELRNGYDIKFNAEGGVIEIDSPDRKDMEEAIVKDLLPVKAINYLVEQRILDDVEEIKIRRDGSFFVEIDKVINDRKLRFDKDGNLSNRK